MSTGTENKFTLSYHGFTILVIYFEELLSFGIFLNRRNLYIIIVNMSESVKSTR